jgi:hypothetical protein
MAKRARKKKAKKSARKATRKAAKRPRRASLSDFIRGIRGLAAASAAAGEEKGACLVPSPGGGPSMCIVTTRSTCAAIKGKFLGGSC